MENILMNNKAELVGELSGGFTYSHESFGEVFYSFTLTVPRLSESVDDIVVTAPERLIDRELWKEGDKLYVSGQFRSYNNYSGVGSRLVLTLFAKAVYPAPLDKEYVNEAVLNGYICKAPTYRTTPFGREITDILLAVNRSHNKSDYIPCIAWGKNARLARDFSVGDNVIITGRMQSRKYQKKLEDETVITKTAYEISVSKIELVL